MQGSRTGDEGEVVAIGVVGGIVVDAAGAEQVQTVYLAQVAGQILLRRDRIHGVGREPGRPGDRTGKPVALLPVLAQELLPLEQEQQIQVNCFKPRRPIEVLQRTVVVVEAEEPAEGGAEAEADLRAPAACSRVSLLPAGAGVADVAGVVGADPTVVARTHPAPARGSPPGPPQLPIHQSGRSEGLEVEHGGVGWGEGEGEGGGARSRAPRNHPVRMIATLTQAAEALVPGGGGTVRTRMMIGIQTRPGAARGISRA